MVPTTIAPEAQAPSPRTSSNRFSAINPPPLPVNPGRTHRAAISRPNTRLTPAPTTNVITAPIITYHVNATLVNRNTNKIDANPANIPASAPRAFAPRSRVPSKNSPSKLPNGSDATVSPASNSGPHRTNPNPINTNPHTSVMRREIRKKPAASVAFPHNREKSSTLDAASEFSAPLALDIATAITEASSKPASPAGISRTKNVGRTRSVRSPAASSGACCANTKSSTPMSRKTVNCISTITPLVSNARRPSRSLRAAKSRCTIVWSVPWLAMVRNAPPISPDQNVYFVAQLQEKSSTCNLCLAAAATCVTSLHPPGMRCKRNPSVTALPVRYSSSCATSVQMTAFIPPSSVYRIVSEITISTASRSDVPSTTLTTSAIAETRTPSATARVIRNVVAATARIFSPKRFSISAYAVKNSPRK